MSHYAYIADRTRKAFASLSALETAVGKDPYDKALQINLSAAKRKSIEAQQELEDAMNDVEMRFDDICDDCEKEKCMAQLSYTNFKVTCPCGKSFEEYGFEEL